MKNFALIGLAGYIAPRHLQAIQDVNCNLVAALDPNDSVGIVDSYFPNSSFFTEFERFDRHLEKLKKSNNSERVDYLTICSPNHLHDAHIRLAMRIAADAICEKPLVLNPWNLDHLQALEEEYGKRVWTILQLRVHPALISLKNEIKNNISNKRYKVRLTYITSRGSWYYYSWKGDAEKSGGIGTNIGVHFFDMLIWLFGATRKTELYIRESNRMGGFLELENADVEWYLSLDSSDIPIKERQNMRTFREITVDDIAIEFSGSFNDLHSTVYEKTISGNGFGIEDARPSIELVHKLRSLKVDSKPKNLVHPSITNLLNIK